MTSCCFALVICYRLLSDAQQRRETQGSLDSPWTGIAKQSWIGLQSSWTKSDEFMLLSSLEEEVVSPVGAWQVGLAEVSKA